jgi:ArsR family transcriptional regulator
MRAKTDSQFTALETMLRALADPTRLRILGLLTGGEVCVCHIHDALNIPQPKASRHLAYLRRSGVVDTRREGLWVHYRLATIADPVVRTLFDSAMHCLGHVETVSRDRKRLEKETGCSPAENAGDTQIACCAC